MFAIIRCRIFCLPVYYPNRTIILPLVLYEFNTWSLRRRDKRKLWVFQNRVLRRIFGPKQDEVTGDWRRLHNEEHFTPYS